ncbi:cytochrome c family protein [Kordiimonas sp. SCSIO 12610]|uniref:c-type cytochrome n=1 Tax=Kordiimonas sp. SCSIO 12610 TaxID=2829597 RepID=UPI0021088775|nr:cytochrome c family protein [Kordiimonas sp. SCSIO 12610]UTW54207.1 cytochrome c family protein [Kordiimonas sp. SCSIO 12610]
MTKTILIAAFLVSMSSLSAPYVMADDDPGSRAISSEGDEAKGKRVFNRCKACHNLTASPRTRVGPNLDNVFGRKAGTSETYKRYSKALKEADFVWTEEKLNEWLIGPRTFLPGNKMAFAGLKNEQQRKDLIAYLRSATVAE